MRKRHVAAAAAAATTAAAADAAATPAAATAPTPLSLHIFTGVSWLVFGLLAVVFGTAAALLTLPHPLAWAWLAAEAGALAVPLRLPAPAWATRFLRFSVRQLRAYFPITVVYDDKDALLSHAGPYLIAFEPHAVLPLGMCVFTLSDGMPPGLANAHVAVTSSIFLAPVIRHLVYWLGSRPASREELRRSLAAGTSVAVCPGGVQECLYMSSEANREVAFLRSRTGFVRLALEAGTPLVPCFAFGQTPHYSCFRPLIDGPMSGLVPAGAMSSLVRRLRYVPMLVWGWLGTALPHQIPMTVVVGKPIEVPQRDSPSAEEVQAFLQRFIDATDDIFRRHKAAAGYPDATLTIL